MFFKHSVTPSMIIKKTKVIYFIDGPAPTEADHAAVERIAKYRSHIVFRNAQHIVKGEALEQCDLVAGAVPSLYANFPHAEENKGDQVPVPAPGAVSTEVTAPASAPVATAPVDGLAPDASEVESWGNYSIKACVSMVGRKEITKERAVALEEAGKKRASLLKQLAAL